MDIDTQVCVVGGGPAGMMLGLVLARRGIDVVVLEKHADFLRDFRGDTVHPSTMDVLDELGLGEALSRVPHRDVGEMRVSFADGSYRVVDFSRLRVAHPYIRFMPQWDFLTVLADDAVTLPGFRLLLSHEATHLRTSGGLVTGIEATGPSGPILINAGLTVGADGRGSVLREQSGLPIREFASPMDVLWFRIPRDRTAPEGLDMHVGAGQILLGIDRGDYWQVALVIPKGADRDLRLRDIGRLRDDVAALAPDLGRGMDEVRSWDDVKTLTVQINRMRRWHRPGLLFIGDAAHAMSPIGGVGINLAVQDAVAAGRMLADPLRRDEPVEQVLVAIQQRRLPPARATQVLQRALQRFLIQRALDGKGAVRSPAVLRMVSRLPLLQGIPAHVVGVGFRPELLGNGR